MKIGTYCNLSSTNFSQRFQSTYTQKLRTPFFVKKNLFYMSGAALDFLAQTDPRSSQYFSTNTISMVLKAQILFKGNLFKVV